MSCKIFFSLFLFLIYTTYFTAICCHRLHVWKDAAAIKLKTTHFHYKYYMFIRFVHHVLLLLTFYVKPHLIQSWGCKAVAKDISHRREAHSQSHFRKFKCCCFFLLEEVSLRASSGACSLEVLARFSKSYSGGRKGPQSIVGGLWLQSPHPDVSLVWAGEEGGGGRDRGGESD